MLWNLLLLTVLAHTLSRPIIKFYVHHLGIHVHRVIRSCVHRIDIPVFWGLGSNTGLVNFVLIYIVFSARCNISRLCYDVSFRLSVHLSVTKVHWRIIANLGFKFRPKFTARARMHCECMRALPHALRAQGAPACTAGAHCESQCSEHEGRDHRREEWRDHLVLCWLGVLVCVL